MQTCSSCSHPNRNTAQFCANCGQALNIGLGTGRLPPNTVLQNLYIIVKKVGEGGMGAVYKAIDQRVVGRLWAVKEMSMALLADPADRAEAVQSFQQEASILARLDHPNLPKVADFFEENGRYYLVMDFIQGETLQEKLDEQGHRPFPDTQVLDWADQLCDVLGYLHSQTPPVIFRDLKPANIMATANDRVKLIDFGIARHFKTGKPRDTQRFGTEGYAPPEQYGHGQTDARSDIYSLGVTLHQLLTGHDPLTSLYDLPAVRQLNSNVSLQVDATIQRATEKHPDDRFQAVIEMRQALASSGPPLPQPFPPPEPPTEQTAQGIPVWGAIIGVILALGLGVVITYAIAVGKWPVLVATINGTDVVQGTPIATRTASVTRTHPAAAETPGPEVIPAEETSETPTSFPTHTFTVIPSRTPSRTPTPLPDATVDTPALHLRMGPGVEYQIRGQYAEDTVLKVLGKEPGEGWLKVEAPDDRTGWMSIAYLQVNIALSGVPVVAVPPTPTPAFTPWPTETIGDTCIGILSKVVTEELQSNENLAVNHGLYIASVFGDPATKAGLHVGDVIVSANGQEVRDHDSLGGVVADTGMGNTFQVGVYRGERLIHLEIKVGRRVYPLKCRVG